MGHQRSATKYGFDLYYGKKKDRTGYDVGGPSRLIYTNGKHKDDLKTLTPREFEKKHKQRGINGERMSAWRFKVVGAKQRPLGWWKTPEVLKLLLSNEMSLNQVRAELSLTFAVGGKRSFVFNRATR